VQTFLTGNLSFLSELIEDQFMEHFLSPQCSCRKIWPHLNKTTGHFISLFSFLIKKQIQEIKNQQKRKLFEFY